MNDWRDTCKHWSLWLSGAGTALLSFFLLAAKDAIWVWNALPAQLTAHIPQRTGLVVGLVLLGLGIVAKFINQKQSVAWVAARLKALWHWIGLMMYGGCYGGR